VVDASITSVMNLWKYLPRVKYNPPADRVQDFASSAYSSMDFLFKLTGWCIVIGTLHYGYVRTKSIFLLYRKVD
jgi:hypothetical protein